MPSDTPPRPVNVTPFPNGEIGIAWDDGRETFFSGFELRCACPCAACVDELSGKKILRDELVPKDVRAESITPVGNYALTIRWSDGHGTGIFSFETLLRLAGRKT